MAHYNRRYEEATELFDTYVESLNYRPAMYYHALSQKAGAEKGMGASSLANYHFLQVFVHSKNLKETAVLSMRINEDPDWEDLIGRTKNQQELNDAYLLLGYHTFNNPLREIAKIVENDPDAIQARILMVRAIHQIERNDLPVYYTAYSYGQDKERQGNETNKRYPIATSLTDEIIDLSDEMTRHPAVKDRNFWLMTSAYLHFLNKEFAQARHYLEQVEEENETYTLQKMNLAFYIDICEPAAITPELEITLYETYTQLLIQNQALQGEAWYHSDTQAFVRDVWANRYYLQQDYAKSFLLTNPISDLEYHPQRELLDRLEAFYHKPDKNPMEKYIAENFYTIHSQVYAGRKNYLDYLQGIICLTEGDISGAHTAFGKTDPADLNLRIPDYVFAANIREWFNVDPDTVMIRDYLADFPFIPEKMDFEELTATLLKLEETGKRKSRLAPKANYLLGNFFYNISSQGYYRHLLRFNTTNFYSSKFDDRRKPDIYNDIYFKNYPVWYENTYPHSEKYLRLAYRQTRDKELKAHIVFALSKCEQGAYYNDPPEGYGNRADMFVSDYFEELLHYRRTSYFEEILSRCRYFEYYVSHSGK
ncbi:MAG: hypothetical protein LUF85_10345 [Bacteroides sp.]|nr:hypothetical protein [Bacteroides sp.]